MKQERFGKHLRILHVPAGQFQEKGAPEHDLQDSEARRCRHPARHNFDAS
jgi:hypothetical protein